MFAMFRKIFSVGIVTRRQPFTEAPPRYRGRIALKAVPGTNWAECAAVCPSRALSAEDGEIVLFRGACVMCGACAEKCSTDAITQTNDGYTAARDKADLYVRLKGS